MAAVCDGCCCARPHTTGSVHVLYRSEVLPPTPYSYDSATGGSPTNYSPPMLVAASHDLTLVGSRQRLQLVFFNGSRNCHLQGEHWTGVWRQSNLAGRQAEREADRTCWVARDTNLLTRCVLTQPRGAGSACDLQLSLGFGRGAQN